MTNSSPDVTFLEFWLGLFDSLYFITNLGKSSLELPIATLATQVTYSILQVHFTLLPYLQ